MVATRASDPTRHAARGPAIPPSERPFLVSMMRYFGIQHLRAERVDTPRSDIAVRLSRSGREPPTLLIGRGWRRNRATNPRLARTQLVHEALHVVGYPHSRPLRKAGFYAYDRRKDRLSRNVYRALAGGEPRFVPEQFGLEPPRQGMAQGAYRSG